MIISKKVHIHSILGNNFHVKEVHMHSLFGFNFHVRVVHIHSIFGFDIQMKNKQFVPSVLHSWMS